MKFSRFLVVVILFSFAACKQTLVEGISDEKSQKIYLVLSKNQIESDRQKMTDNTWQIRVKQKDYTRALQHLQNKLLLDTRPLATTRSAGIMAGAEERAAQLDRILAEQIEQTCLKISGVLDARVHISPGNNRNNFLNLETKNKFCSVMLFIDDKFNLKLKDIKRFISGATGIAKKNVKIVTTSAPSISEATTENSLINTEEKLPNGNRFKLIAISTSLIIIGALLMVFKKTRRSKEYFL